MPRLSFHLFVDIESQYATVLEVKHQSMLRTQSEITRLGEAVEIRILFKMYARGRGSGKLDPVVCQK